MDNNRLAEIEARAKAATSMVEKVAIAISGAPFPSKRSMVKARRAIEAMREPSFEMGEAGHVPVEAISDMQVVPYDSVTHKSCVDIWQAMIDEALNG